MRQEKIPILSGFVRSSQATEFLIMAITDRLRKAPQFAWMTSGCRIYHSLKIALFQNLGGFLKLSSIRDLFKPPLDK